MGKKSADTPDVVGAAEREGEFSRETARDALYADRPDQYNALGSNTWQQNSVRDPATGEMTTKWTQRTNLSPEMQELYNQDVFTNTALGNTAAGLTKRANNELGQPLDWSQFGQGQEGPQSAGRVGANLVGTTPSKGFGYNSGNIRDVGNTTGGDQFGYDTQQAQDVNQTTAADNAFNWDGVSRRQGAEDAAYQRATNRLDPQMEQRRKEAEVRLRNRGLRAGDQAYDSEMATFNTGVNDAYEQARLGSVSQGRAEDAQSYGQAAGTYGMNRGTEQQAFGQNLAAGQYEMGRDQQGFNQAQGAFNTNLGQQQQRFGQQATTAQNARASDAQAFQQQSAATDRANALRDKDIQEYLGKRSQTTNEIGQLRNARDVGGMTNTYGSGS